MKCLIYQEQIPGPGEEGFKWCRESIAVNSPNTELIVIDHHGESAERLRADYEHHSVNPPDFEFRGISRWLDFVDCCHANSIKEFFTMDSDCLLFCQLEEECQRWGDCPLSVMNAHRPGTKDGTLSAGCSFFRSLEPLEAFTDWVKFIYKHKECNDWKVLLSIGDHNSDMWLWTYFLIHSKYEWNDLCWPRNGRLFDPNMCVIAGWDNDGHSKTIAFDKGTPIGVFRDHAVKLNALHCWGVWKTRMQVLWEASRK